MAKKTSRQNPVDEAYLRSLMAGLPYLRSFPLPERPAVKEKTPYSMRRVKRLIVWTKRQLTM